MSNTASEPADRPAPGAPRRRWRLVLTALALLASMGWGVSAWWHTGGAITAPLAATAASPFLNTRAGVRYVGTERCAACHPRRAASYAQHPMGRSASPPGRGLPAQDTASPAFEAAGLHYTVERRGNATYHREAALTADGRVIAETTAETVAAIGSGRQGQSFLVNRAGQLVQSPISWYTAAKRWRLSPDYERHNQHFNRRVVEACLFCHVQEAHAEPDTVNTYRPARLKLEPIGCERCHGPGELHAAARAQGGADGDVDRTIVNPRHLTPALREAVCEQCHLQGAARIVRRGHSVQDYRPGLPLDEFVTVFVPPPEQGDARRAVGQVEQLHLGRCFQASAGKLGCISCHDPHVLPAAAERVSWYRSRCLSCHQEHGCAVPVEQRRRDAADSCIACHMPRADSSNIAHTSVTDHRILRQLVPDQQIPPPSVPELVPFHRPPGGEQRADVERDLGLALVEALGKPYPAAVRAELARRACTLLGPTADAAPEDVPALDGLARALHADQRADQALTVLEQVLRQAPRHELALEQAARITLDQGDTEHSLAYWQRLVAVNPSQWEGRGFLAQTQALRRQWDAAATSARAALRLDPFQAETRMLRIDCLLRAGRGTEARAEFDTLTALRPTTTDALRRWFDKLPRTGSAP